jgi:lipoate-protein ligase A
MVVNHDFFKREFFNFYYTKAIQNNPMLKYGIRTPIRHIFWTQRRHIGGIDVPFQDDLDGANDDDLGLGDFQHYVPVGSKDDGTKPIAPIAPRKPTEKPQNVDNSLVFASLEQVATLKSPLVVVSKLCNPFVNLAIEDYVYNAMGIPKNDTENYNRLMFYTNSPCVVIGKNQNPWKEANIPLLTSLRIPLVRRRSGGGTVVHDHGNVNFSFMTTKERFDRFKFAELVKDSINGSGKAKYKLQVNSRGDITTDQQQDGINYKTSGSAYKLSKGKSYHHGTMLLTLNLKILGKLLSRDVEKLGVVDAMNSIDSVKSKVVNIEMEQEDFVNCVTESFEKEYGEPSSGGITNELEHTEEFDQNELFGLTDFVDANSTEPVTIFTIDETTELPEGVTKVSNELQEWSWRFGATPKFTHELTNKQYGFKVKFHVGKDGFIEKFDLDFDDQMQSIMSKELITESFEFLQLYIKDNQLPYIGSSIAGFVTNDVISDWVGNCIDGTN